MKNSTNTFIMILTVTTGLFVTLGMNVQDDEKEPKKAAEAVTETKIEFPPVDDMHHFMEYISEPSYKALKEAMTTKPENRKGWKGIKNHSLVLAETASIVAARAPEDSDKKKQWTEISKAVYDSGAALYQAARKMKYEDAKTHYGAMIDHCNKCHQVFDNGKHQLEK